MNSIEKRGRVLVAAIIAITLISDAVVISLAIADWGIARSGSSLIRWFITAALLCAVWKGHAWARWLTVTLFALGFLLVAYTAIRSFHPLLAILAVQFGATVGLLAFSSSVSSFMAFQRARLL
jgi:hypothetical protein